MMHMPITMPTPRPICGAGRSVNFAMYASVAKAIKYRVRYGVKTCRREEKT